MDAVDFGKSATGKRTLSLFHFFCNSQSSSFLSSSDHAILSDFFQFFFNFFPKKH